MTEIGKILMLAGAVLLVVGVGVWALGRAGFRGLPGDIAYESRDTRVYFPIVSCVVLSIPLSAGLWLWQWLSRK